MREREGVREGGRKSERERWTDRQVWFLAVLGEEGSVRSPAAFAPGSQWDEVVG